MDHKLKIRLHELEQIIGYKFNNLELLLEALIHPSNAIENNLDNERLEFLGDAVLNLIIAESLFVKHKKSFEDKLSAMRAKLISCEAICHIAQDLKMRDYLLLSQGEEKNGGRDNPRNIENATEAVIGAIYIDGGCAAAKEFVARFWAKLINDDSSLSMDSKTFLQEWSQKNKFGTPIYKVISQSGPSHSPLFAIDVIIENVGIASASGSNKKETEKLAALRFIEQYLKA